MAVYPYSRIALSGVAKKSALSGAGRIFKWEPNYSFEAICNSA